MVFAIAAFAIVTCFSARPTKKRSSMRKLGIASRANFRTRKNYRTYMLVSRRTYRCQHLSKRKPVNGSDENEPSTIQSRTPTQSDHARNAIIPRPVGARHAAYAVSRWAVLFLNECAREPCLAPDRAAILVSRDTTPRQAARQVKANVLRKGTTMAGRVDPWTAVYDKIEVVHDTKRSEVPPATKMELDGVESELGFKLPKSYRAFMTRFGPGSLVGYWLLPIVPKQTRPRETVTEITLTNRERIRKYGTECSSNPEWDLGMVVFGSYGPHSFVWNSADAASDGDERCVYDVCYEEEQPPNKIAESFWRFVEYIEVGSRHPRNPYKRGEGGLYFQPATLSGKKGTK